MDLIQFYAGLAT